MFCHSSGNNLAYVQHLVRVWSKHTPFSSWKKSLPPYFFRKKKLFAPFSISSKNSLMQSHENKYMYLLYASFANEHNRVTWKVKSWIFKFCSKKVFTLLFFSKKVFAPLSMVLARVLHKFWTVPNSQKFVPFYNKSIIKYPLIQWPFHTLFVFPLIVSQKIRVRNRRYSFSLQYVSIRLQTVVAQKTKIINETDNKLKNSKIRWRSKIKIMHHSITEQNKCICCFSKTCDNLRKSGHKIEKEGHQALSFYCRNFWIL